MTTAPTPISHSARLRAKIDLVRPALQAAGRRFFTHAQPASLYREYLATSHGVVRASVPLMHVALARAEANATQDAVASALVGYLREHIVEELDHDEWLLEDFESIGGDRSEVLDRIPSPAVATLVGAQYYWIHHRHPVALLGYMAVLEGDPPSLRLIERLIERTGHPRSGFRTMIEHADVDQAHGEEVFALIDDLPLDSGLSTLLGISAMHTVAAMAAVIDEAVDRCGPAVSEGADYK